MKGPSGEGVEEGCPPPMVGIFFENVCIKKKLHLNAICRGRLCVVA